MTWRTRTWTLGPWDKAILAVLLSWRGSRAFRPTFHAAVRAALADDPLASKLTGTGESSAGRMSTMADRRVIKMIIMLDRAGLITRDNTHIQIIDRPGIQGCLDAGSITYSWEKEE